MKRVLAFDYGASSGRAILFTYDGERILADEIHRFDNTPVRIDGTLCWDFDALKNELFTGIKKGVEAGGFDSIGIDTWGVDFGLLDKDGNLISTPVHYRDERTQGMPEEVFSIIPKEEIYSITGIQTMDFNTLFQLHYLNTYQRELLEKTDKFLLIPDLFAYYLTGAKKAEKTIASTTQLMDAKTKEWSFKLIDKLNLPRSIFPEIIDSGNSYGLLSDELCAQFGIKPVPVVAVCCHDTASAIFSVPSSGEPLYLSCGTWSLLGTLSTLPVLSKESMQANFTNETGFDGVTRYLKNIMGLWIINECRREWKKSNPSLSFGEIVAQAQKVAENKFIIDVDDDAFLRPDGMPERIQAYCQDKYGSAPESMGEIARCVYESLCYKYKQVISALEKVSGNKYREFFVVGGGAKAEYLCKMIASVCGIKVYAGPVEATAIGNALVQFIYLNAVESDDGLKELIKTSFEVKIYE